MEMKRRKAEGFNLIEGNEEFSGADDALSSRTEMAINDLNNECAELQKRLMSSFEGMLT